MNQQGAQRGMLKTSVHGTRSHLLRQSHLLLEKSWGNDKHAEWCRTTRILVYSNSEYRAEAWTTGWMDSVTVFGVHWGEGGCSGPLVANSLARAPCTCFHDRDELSRNIICCTVHRERGRKGERRLATVQNTTKPKGKCSEIPTKQARVDSFVCKEISWELFSRILSWVLS